MYSRTILIGRVGRDAELKQAGQNSVLNFSVATGESWRDQNGEWKEITTWHSVQVWGKLAEALVGKILKGDLVLVEGTERENEYNGKKYRNVRAAVVKRLNSRKTGAPVAEPTEDGPAPEAEKNPYPPAADGSDDEPSDDELPF
jgi:single-strand DNA-binding protein